MNQDIERPIFESRAAVYAIEKEKYNVKELTYLK
jgi:hypothetical protein